MASIGTGMTLGFSSGFAAEITSMNWSGIEREVIEATHSLSTSKTFIPGSFVDPGELEVGIFFHAETAPPFTAAPETVTVTLPSAGAGGTSTWVATGFMREFEWSAEVEGVQEATMTLKLTTSPVITP